MFACGRKLTVSWRGPQHIPFPSVNSNHDLDVFVFKVNRSLLWPGSAGRLARDFHVLERSRVTGRQ